MRTVVYPGTFDPIHNGHLDLVKRIAAQYDCVIVAVAQETDNKTPCLTFAERLNLTSMAVQALTLSNVKVLGFTGRLTNFVRSQGSTTILRGIRNEKDIQTECIISYVTRSPLVSGFFSPRLEVICLLTDPAYQYISSTEIRKLSAAGLAINHLVPKEVAEHGLNATARAGFGSKYALAYGALTLWSRYKAALAGVAVGFLAGYCWASNRKA